MSGFPSFKCCTCAQELDGEIKYCPHTDRIYCLDCYPKHLKNHAPTENRTKSFHITLRVPAPSDPERAWGFSHLYCDLCFANARYCYSEQDCFEDCDVLSFPSWYRDTAAGRKQTSYPTWSGFSNRRENWDVCHPCYLQHGSAVFLRRYDERRINTLRKNAARMRNNTTNGSSGGSASSSSTSTANADSRGKRGRDRSEERNSSPPEDEWEPKFDLCFYDGRRPEKGRRRTNTEGEQEEDSDEEKARGSSEKNRAESSTLSRQMVGKV